MTIDTTNPNRNTDAGLVYPTYSEINEAVKKSRNIK
jgi:hypothetical protein